MKKPRHVNLKKGRYYYVANAAMRAAGIRSESLGVDAATAFPRAERLNDAWDKSRNAEIEPPSTGQFAELINQFQRDPFWYGRLAPVTKEDIDRAFRVIAAEFKDAPVAVIEARHVRNFANRLRVDGGIHRARKIHKWLHRLFRYSIEIGVREYNPAANMRFEQPPSRTATWSQDQIEKLIAEALSGGVAESGNVIPPRPSVALATMIAYDTAQRQADILSLRWPQYDGEGITVTQAKTGKTLWLPLTRDTRAAIDTQNRTSLYIVVSEVTGRPYDKNTFSRIFRKFRRRAGIHGVHFHDIRRTVATELGDAGATSAEIVSITGHAMGSKTLDIYVRPGRQAARRAAKKRRGE